MKTYLALISSFGMAMQMAITAAPEPDYKFPQFLRQSEVNIPQSYTPFGNRLEFNRFGDDGSSCLLDANGVLTWVDNKGTVRLLPDTSLAIPLFVTNTECLVWNNRFVDYTAYPDRPKAELKLFRSEPGSSDITFSTVNVEGKEIVETPPITTTTGTLNFIATTRRDNGKETQVGGTTYNFNDESDNRIYRLTFDGNVQFVKPLPLLVDAVPNFGTNVAGPETRSMGFGSDGSLIVKFKDVWLTQTTVVDADLEDSVYWIDSQGRPEKVVLPVADATINRVLFASNTRLVYEYTTTAPATVGIQEQRRSLSSGALLPSATADITGVTGTTIDISNYAKNGDKRYFYTVDPADAHIVRSYQLVDGGIDPAFTRMATLPETVSVGSVTGTVNPTDGSTLIFGEDGNSLIWLNSSAPGFNLIPDSSRASALYVTDSQAVVWENARAPLNGDGSIPAAVVKHYSRDTTTNVLTATKLVIDGTTLLNTTRTTPDFDFWLLTSAEKTQPSTTLLRTYRLASSLSIDSDDDGIPDGYETNTKVYVSRIDTGSDPSDPDTDDDGRSDGDEVYPFVAVDGGFTWSKAKADAISKGGHMATISNQVEYKGLQRQLADKQIFSLWLGASDQAIEGTFVWVTGASYDFNTAHDPAKTDNWAPGQPDNLQDSDGLVMRADFLWADAPVSEKRGYVMEYPSSDPCKKDTDGDGLNDGAEFKFTSNPTKVDTDGDSLSDKDEKNYGTNPRLKDTDGDSLTDSAEVQIHNTNPLVKDTDTDGLEDGDEVALGTNPRVKDTDGDGLNDGDEISLGSNPLKKDTDGDGLNDGRESNLGTNPLKKDTDGDGISDFDEDQAGSDPLDKSSPKNDDTDNDGLTDFEELFTYHTDPKSADTDGDGLKDGREIRLGTNPNKKDTDGDGLNDRGEVDLGSNPFKPDTDGDGLTDGQEAKLRTNPTRKDTDGDGLTDSQEVNGYHGFKSNPLLEDTDGDGYSDFDELNAKPPTDPKNYRSYPSKGLKSTAATAGYHSGVSPISEQLVEIDSGFTPFGQRPDITKNGEDGSVLIRDRNGVLIWVNKKGISLVLPDTSLAAPLIVTNNECVVWSNRYADYDNYGEKQQVGIVIFRRTADGAGIEDPIPLNLRGKQIINTSEVSAATFGFVLSTTELFDDGQESLRITTDNRGNITEIPHDQWDGLRLRSYRIAWDGAVQRLTTYTTDVPKAQDDPFVDTLGFGSDGAVIFNLTEALTFRTPFQTYVNTHWATGDGTSHIVPNFDEIASAAYVSNSRILLVDEQGALGDYNRSGDNVTLENTFNPVGNVLPIASYSKVGAPVLVYTVDNQERLHLYEVRNNLKDLGVTQLPITPASNPVYIRNPEDGSLLLRDARNGGIAWIPTTKQDGTIVLGDAALMPQTGQAAPMYVNSKEAIVWSNAGAPVNVDGEIRPAEITHYYINANGLPQPKRLAPPIKGNYVLNASSLSPSANNPGWYIRTTEKVSAQGVRIRTYRMDVPNTVDSDGDGVPDVDEEDNGTDPFDSDSDGDGISDGQELIDGTDPLKRDTDGDGLADNIEKNLGTNPVKFDTDNDGLSDGQEVKNYKTDPLRQDTDGDGLTDYEEVTPNPKTGYTSNPLLSDTDEDGFSDYEEATARPPTNPRDPKSRPETNTVDDGDGTAHDQVVLLRDPVDVSISASFSPFGNRTNFNRYGDDGSAMLVDKSGVLLWQDDSGNVRRINNSEQAAPLIVSGLESIVWTNAFADYEDYENKPAVKVSIYRANPVTGVIGAPTPVVLQGKEIIATAPITTTTESYTLITSEHELDLGIGSEVIDDSVFRIYRVTFSGTIQRLGQIEVADTGSGGSAASLTKAMGHGSDDSIILSQDTQTGLRRVFWVNGAQSNSAGLWVELSAATAAANLAEDTQLSRVVYTSANRAVYEKFVRGAPTLFEARRNSFTGALVSDLVPARGSVSYDRLLQVSTQTKLGDTRWFYAVNTGGSKILALRLTNVGVELAYEAALPSGFTLDATASVEKINPQDGSAVIVSDNADGLFWIHNGGKNNASQNLIEVPGSRYAQTIFVQGQELVLWTDAYEPVPGSGRLDSVKIRHYEQKNGELINPRQSSTDLSPFVAGDFVMTTPPFTQEYPYWVFTTVEKTGADTARIRNYSLKDAFAADDDSDHLSNVEEQNPKDSSPFPVETDPKDPDSDNDGIDDGLELQPFRIVTGNYTLEEARRDAIKRGGRLAVPDTASKQKRLQQQLKGSNLGINLWLGGGDMEGPDDKAGQREGEYAWVNNDGRFFNAAGNKVSEDFTYSNWAVRQPSNVGDADGVQLKEDFTWAATQVTQQQGYVLEFPATDPTNADTDGDGVSDGVEIEQGTNPRKRDTDGDGVPDVDNKNPDPDGDGLTSLEEFGFGTNPNKKDTDGDGVNDYDEVYITGTDPTEPSFGNNGGSGTIAFGSSAVNGDYEGLVFDPAKGLSFKQTLRLAADGSFSSKLLGLRKDTSFRGKFSAKGSFLGVPGDAEGVTKVQMNVVKNGKTSYYIQGSYVTRTGGKLYFVLRPYAYSSTKSYKGARKVTFEASLSGDSSGPSGSAVATGKISSDGKVSFNVYLPDGSRGTFSGPILDGDSIALYVRSETSSHPVMIGSLKLQSLQGVSDFSGAVRLFCASGSNGSLFPSGYDQERNLIGSNYYTPAVGTMPLSTFDVSDNNAVLRWRGGNFGGVVKVGTWSTDGQVSIPYTQNDSANVEFNSETGLMSVNYDRTDASRDLNNASAKAFAVVLQKNKTVKGYYKSDASAADFVVKPNNGDLQPDITSVSPSSKSVPAALTTYTVTVQTEGAWTVVIPTDLPWITATVDSENGKTGDSATTKGKGNGTVVVRVARNITNARREGVIQIAGLNHKVKQEFR